MTVYMVYQRNKESSDYFGQIRVDDDVVFISDSIDIVDLSDEAAKVLRQHENAGFIISILHRPVRRGVDRATYIHIEDETVEKIRLGEFDMRSMFSEPIHERR